MHANVFITHKRGNEILDQRVGHNVWVDTGREYLSRLAVDPPVENARVKYMGFGIGGIKQVLDTSLPPLSTSYPAGSDPNATTGSEYNPEYPVSPDIRTLERPVRISGGTSAYPGAGGDVWLAQPPHIQSFIEGTTTFVLKATIDTTLGHILYGPFLSMPLSEAGLFLSTIDPTDDPYSLGHLVAYHAFVTLLLVPDAYLEVVWKVQF